MTLKQRFDNAILIKCHSPKGYVRSRIEVEVRSGGHQGRVYEYRFSLFHVLQMRTR